MISTAAPDLYQRFDPGMGGHTGPGLLGVAFCWRDRAFRFLLTVLLTHTAVSTTFLYPNLPRYLTGEVAIYVLVGAAGLIGTIRAGLRLADRYRLRYGSERSSRIVEGTVWISQGTERLPYKAELFGE